MSSYMKGHKISPGGNIVFGGWRRYHYLCYYHKVCFNFPQIYIITYTNLTKYAFLSLKSISLSMLLWQWVPQLSWNLYHYLCHSYKVCLNFPEIYIITYLTLTMGASTSLKSTSLPTLLSQNRHQLPWNLYHYLCHSHKVCLNFPEIYIIT